MKKIIFLTLLSFSISFLSSCDVIEVPYRKEIVLPPPVGTDDSTSKLRNILVEKFTGSNCGPCPEVSQIVQTVEKDFIRVNVISYHAGNLARPNANDGLTYDFRTSVGTTIGMDFFDASNPLSINTPSVVIDRLNYGTSISILVQKGNIIQESLKRIAVESPLNVTLYPWYNPTNRTVEVSGNVIYFEPGTKDYRIGIALVENNIKQPQKKADGKIDTAYVHQFVFRTNVPTFAWGEEVSTQDVSAGSIIPYNKSIQLPENVDWNPANFEIVVYVYKNTDAPIETREVLQSSRKKVSIVQ